MVDSVQRWEETLPSGAAHHVLLSEQAWRVVQCCRSGQGGAPIMQTAPGAFLPENSPWYCLSTRRYDTGHIINGFDSSAWELPFLWHQWYKVAYRDHYIRRLSVRPSICLDLFLLVPYAFCGTLGLLVIIWWRPVFIVSCKRIYVWMHIGPSEA